MLSSSITRDFGSLILTLCGVRKGCHRRVRRGIPRVRNLGAGDLHSPLDAPDVHRATVARDNGWRRNECRLHQQRTARPDRGHCVCRRFCMAPAETSPRPQVGLEWRSHVITLDRLFTSGDCERRDSVRQKSAAEASQAQSVEHRKLHLRSRGRGRRADASAFPRRRTWSRE